MRNTTNNLPAYKRIARNIIRRVIGGKPAARWLGEYASWDDALTECAGYDQKEILERVVSATKQVLSGDKAYERDGTTFDTPAYNWALIAALGHCAFATRRLSVADIGGALGSSYLQNRAWIGAMPEVSWRIVEQKTFVEAAAKLDFSKVAPSISFSDAYEASLAGANFLLFGSSLSYLADPYEYLKKASHAPVEYLLIERTPYAQHDRGKSFVSKQVVTSRGETHTYPCWVFSEKEMTAFLTKDWEQVACWDSEFQPADDPIHISSFWKRRAHD